MIRLEAMTFGYGERLVFERFSWEVRRGEIWAILGPSGCGKSTLLLLLAALLHPQAGTIRIEGRTWERPRPRTGLILQDYGLLPWATVRENAALGLRIRRFYGPDGRHAPRDMTTADLDRRVGYWLERLGIASLAGAYPAQLSGGQRQRTAIARTFALEPDLLLMDEPFSALDAPTRESLQELTLALCAERGVTALLVTHAIEEAAFVGQRILLLGEPPNRRATIIENPHVPAPDYRTHPDYRRTVAELRRRLEVFR